MRAAGRFLSGVRRPLGPPSPWAIPPLAAVAFVAACGEGEEREAAFGPSERWDVERELAIGSLDDGEESLTFIGPVLVRSDGGVLVAQPQDAEVRAYSPDGDLETVIGREGEGPGEFQFIASMGWRGSAPADTFWVSDGRLQRVSFFTGDGTFVEDASLPRGAWEEHFHVRSLHALLPDGGGLAPTSFGAHLLEEGEVTERPLVRLAPELDEVEGKVTAVPAGNSQITISSNGGMLFTSQPWPDNPLLEVRGDGRVAVVDRTAETADDAAEIRVEVFDPSGETVAQVTHAVDARPLGGEEVERETEELVDRLLESPFGESLGRRGLESQIRDALYVPAYVPPVEGARWVGEDLWLRMETREAAGLRDGAEAAAGGSERGDGAGTVNGAEPALWWVLDADGEMEARVVLEEGGTPRARQGDALWVSETDEYDVPYLVRYRLAGPRGSAASPSP